MMDVRPRAYVECPVGWGATQILYGHLLKLGYKIDHVRKLGHSLLVIR
jgi:hypothetical protein